ncbi:hypothetical protein FISHEDRAFT_69303 [Fistulina hepatica ATCC 64428]|uniref:Uncharacterized protein n=1 Tax=Fistulina hepatica ATCC 64428 TaxID=1128425 RepID=A0A0D7AMS7_9AGAR|nr:hypothetical protein FISHEDRAFT_69303 [Fistulina hepatica ATCC 64428]
MSFVAIHSNASSMQCGAHVHSSATRPLEIQCPKPARLSDPPPLLSMDPLLIDVLGDLIRDTTSPHRVFSEEEGLQAFNLCWINECRRLCGYFGYGYFQTDSVSDSSSSSDGTPGNCGWDDSTPGESPSFNQISYVADRVPSSCPRSCDWPSDCVVSGIQENALGLEEMSLSSYCTHESSAPFQSMGMARHIGDGVHVPEPRQKSGEFGAVESLWIKQYTQKPDFGGWSSSFFH